MVSTDFRSFPAKDVFLLSLNERRQSKKQFKYLDIPRFETFQIPPQKWLKYLDLWAKEKTPQLLPRAL